MQSALGSLRQAGPSKRAVIDAHHMLWGVGSDHLSLAGHFKFRVLKGAVMICGITLNATKHQSDDESSYFCVSSPVPPYPVISAVHDTQSNSINNDIIKELQDFAAVIEVRTDPDFVRNISDLAPPYKQLWHTTYQFPLELEESAESTLQIPKTWLDLDLSAAQFVVLGPKNSGKSSLARFLCNKLVCQNGAVGSKKKPRTFYLELDPGQPEFTVPGCLSLHEISELNFSPGYFHPDFRGVKKCHYLGYVSPSETPTRYLDLCQDLLALYQRLKAGGDRLIINTPGWTKGLGLELNTAIVNMAEQNETSVTTVIHMGSSSDFQFAAVEVDSIGSDDNSGSTITQGGFSSAELRSLQIMNYLHRSWTTHLTEWAPYEVSLSDVSIAVLDSEGVDLQENLKICIEGTLVAILLVNPEDDGDCIQKELLEPHEANRVWQHADCVGMAVVQRLNLRSLHLLVPVALSELGLKDEKRVILMRGRVQLPLWEVYNRKLGRSPWISTSKAPGLGGAYSKFRRNIQR